MDGLETPYEVEVPIDFIDCSSCNKSIRSETLYKIHLTTIGHIKKEEALVSSGLAIRNHIVPEFEDILQYLQYLNLDEPIIGLSHLEEVIGSDANDPQPGPRYFCRLCSLEANLPNMINHIIGRKHRQKYLMTQRKDLVTWDNSTTFNQPAKVIRAKSEVVERQDGRGTPRPMRRNEGKSNITRVPQKQRYKKVPPNAGQRGAPPYPGPVHNSSGHYSHHEGQPPPFHHEDHYLGPEEEGRGQYQRRKPPHQDGYMEEDHDRPEFMDSDYHRGYPEDPMGGGQHRDYPLPRAEGRPMRGFVEEMPHTEAYERDASPYRRPHPESDPLKQFYSEELRRERARANEAAAATTVATDGRSYPSRDLQETCPGGGGDGNNGNRTAYTYASAGSERQNPGGRPCGPRYPPEAPGRDYPRQGDRFDDDDRRGPPDESDGDEYGHRAAGYPEAQRWDYTDGHHPHQGSPGQDRRGNPEPRRNAAHQPLDRDYLFEMVGALRDKAAAPPREAGSPYQKVPEGVRGMSEIPEPFRRFLQRNASSQDIRKRKSRFSDATQEEMEGSKRMLMQSDGFPVQSREWPEAHGAQRLDPYAESNSMYQSDGYTEGNVEKPKDGGKVFDLLKNIEIENGEEADFLKSRLCNLLKEFQAKRSEKTLSRPDSAAISRDYNHRSEAQWPARAPSPPPPPPHAEPGRAGREAGREAFRDAVQRRPQTESHPRATDTHSRATDSHLRPSQDPVGWEEEEQQGGPAAQRFQEHRRPVHPDGGASSRQRYEEVFGGVTQHRAQHAPRPEQPDRQRFQGSGDYHYEYQPDVPEFFSGRAAASPPSYHREQGYRVPRGPQHTSSLDKITSTLLELVARK